MSDEVQQPADEKSRLATLAVQWVVIPLAVVLFCVAVAALFMWLTSERKGFDDYLNALRANSGEAAWKVSYRKSAVFRATVSRFVRPVAR